MTSFRTGRRAGTLLLALLAVSCSDSAPRLFQPDLAAATAVARQRHGGDVVLFVSDKSPLCRRVRKEIFGAPPVRQFIAANFGAVEIRAESDAAREALARYQAPSNRPQIIIASERLNNLHVHILRLDKVEEERFLAQLRTVKQAKTIDEYRQVVRREVRPPSSGAAR